MFRPHDLSFWNCRKAVTVVAAFVCSMAVVIPARSQPRVESGDRTPREVAPRGAPAASPVWVPNVVRIDRNRETRDRIGTDVAEEPRYTFVGTHRPAPAVDGSFTTEDGRIRIAGIHLPERSQLCRSEDGRRWACGLSAHTAFTVMIFRQKLDCRPVGPSGLPVPLFDCARDKRSIAETLVGAGWAELDEATADARLVAAFTKAKAEGRGMWAHEPPTTSDDPDSPAR